MIGSHPIASYLLNNTTIAASSGGTAAATVLVSSISATYAKSWEVHNLTGNPIELIIGAEAGTSAIGIFYPGNTSAASVGVAVRQVIALQQGMAIRARTVLNAAVTVSATLPIHISLWA